MSTEQDHIAGAGENDNGRSESAAGENEREPDRSLDDATIRDLKAIESNGYDSDRSENFPG